MPRVFKPLPVAGFQRRFEVIERAFQLVALMHAQLGGPERPWFHPLYTVPGITLPLPLSLSRRTLLTTSISVATLGAYMLPFPAHRASPFLLWMCSFMLSTTVLSIVFGHALYAALLQRPPDGGVWTGPKVARYVRARWGVEVGPVTGWRWLRDLGFTLQVPRPSHPRSADRTTRRSWKKT